MAIVHSAPQRPSRGLRPRSRTILESVINNYSNLKYRRASASNNNKIKLKLPKLKLRNLRKRKRVYPGGRPRRPRPPPRFNRNAPPPPATPPVEPAKPEIEASAPEPIVYDDAVDSEITEPELPELPELPRPKDLPSEPVIYKSSEPLVHQSEDESENLKIFKFELSEAKPNKYPYTPLDVVNKDDPTPPPSPVYFIGDNGEIFPEEITNSFQEFASVTGSDGKKNLSN